MLTIGSLFSGIGGLELGLERAGLGPVLWQVEREPFCRRVLAKHWPTATRYDDVQRVGEDLPRVGVLCGGFPCQDISTAGEQRGLDGERSGLWREFARLIRLLRPGFVVIENVAALLDRGIDRVLSDLSACGYDAEWSVVSACSAGAPHTRERLFIVAYSNGVNGVPRLGPEFRPYEDNWARKVWDHGNGERAQGYFGVRMESRPSRLRVADGVPDRVDRLHALGNAVVPAVAEVVGRRVIELAGGFV